MAAKITINTQIKDLLARLERAPANFDRALVGEVHTSGFQVRAFARLYAPARTGILRNSISVRFENAGLSTKIGTGVWYARFQKPFLRRAWRQERPQFIKRVSGRLHEAMR